MALRSKAKSLPGLSLAGLLLFGVTPPIAAQSHTFEVRHRHWHKGAMGTLRISPDEISFEEHGKKGKTDSRSWRYEEIQQLEVSPSASAFSPTRTQSGNSDVTGSTFSIACRKT